MQALSDLKEKNRKIESGVMTVASQTGRYFHPASSPKLHILKGKAFTTRRNNYLCYLLNISNHRPWIKKSIFLLEMTSKNFGFSCFLPLQWKSCEMNFTLFQGCKVLNFAWISQFISPISSYGVLVRGIGGKITDLDFSGEVASHMRCIGFSNHCIWHLVTSYRST